MENAGKLPFTTGQKEEEDVEVTPASPAAPRERVTVLADGTYATIAEEPTLNESASADRGPHLRSLIMNGEFFVGVAMATALAKLALRVRAGPRALGT